MPERGGKLAAASRQSPCTTHRAESIPLPLPIPLFHSFISIPLSHFRKTSAFAHQLKGLGGLLASKKSSQLEASKTSGLSPTITASRVYFSILQAADYTSATPSWIEEQLRNGKLPYRWIGNKRVIFRRDLDELMESLPVETGLCDVPAFIEKSQKGKAAA